MRHVALGVVFLLVCPIAHAQMHCRAMASPGGISPCAKNLAAAVPEEEFQKVDWPAIMVNLKNSPALPFFKQGMTQYYGLNYEEAIRNFKMAKEKNPTMAMASWGIALAAGPNINLSMTDACHKLACEEIKRADSLAATNGSTLEKALISALKERYVCPAEGLSVSDKESNDAAKRYRDAMASIWDKNKADKNVSTLYAESMMDLNPWDLYDPLGLPKRKETVTIVGVLKDSIGDSPEAIGANHYYIHAVEGSNPDSKIGSIHPAEALSSANLLQTQVAASGHLVHMSSHIYLLLGEYKKSLAANIRGANNDVMQYGKACHGTYAMYTKNENCPQLYYGHYLSHNYFFGSVSATFLGQSKNAMALACDTQAHVQRFIAYEPGLQRYLSAPLMTMVVNRNWDAICAETDCKGPNPYDQDSNPNKNFKEPKFEDCYNQGQEGSPCHILRAIWYWARGMARAAKDDGDVQPMYADLTAMANEIDTIPPCSEATRTSSNTFGNNCAEDVLRIGQWILNARIQWTGDDKDSWKYTLLGLREAVDWENRLVYDEPPQWFTPAREAFGGFYLQAAKNSVDGQSTEHYKEALDVFNEALLRHPASGRALYGKMRALQGLRGKDSQAAKQAKEAFDQVWLTADYTMTDADLWPDMKGSSEELVAPSQCSCLSTTWPPPPDAGDVGAGDVQGGVVGVNYELLKCSKKKSISASNPSATGTRPLP